MLNKSIGSQECFCWIPLEFTTRSFRSHMVLWIDCPDAADRHKKTIGFDRMWFLIDELHSKPVLIGWLVVSMESNPAKQNTLRFGGTNWKVQPPSALTVVLLVTRELANALDSFDWIKFPFPSALTYHPDTLAGTFCKTRSFCPICGVPLLGLYSIQ